MARDDRHRSAGHSGHLLRVKRAVDRVPGSSAALTAIGFTLATAAAAGLGAPKDVWIATLVLAAILAVIAIVRFIEERTASASHQPDALPTPPKVSGPPGNLAHLVPQEREPQRVIHTHEPAPTTFDHRLNRMIRRGSDLVTESEMAGDRATEAEVRRYRAEEDEWTAAVEDLLAKHDALRRFCEASGFPSSGVYAISNRVEARVAVLREIRDERSRENRPRDEPDAIEPRSLALRLRHEARAFARLRSNVLTDPLTQTALPPAQYDAELDRLTRGVAALLERHGEHEFAHEFMAEIPAALLSGFGIHGNNRDRLKREIRVYEERLDTIANRLVARNEDRPPVDRIELAREAYRAGHKLLPRMTWGEGAPTSVEEAVEGTRRIRDMASKWACDVWVMLGEQFPGQERRFAPEVDPNFGRSGFQMAATEAMKSGQTPHTYVNAKLALLAELIEREENRR